MKKSYKTRDDKPPLESWNLDIIHQNGRDQCFEYFSFSTSKNQIVLQ